MTGRIIHGGGITAAAARHGGRPADWLDLSTGINPNPVAVPDLPPEVWHRLPDAGLVEAAREAARSYYRSGVLRPLPVPGTQAVIQLLPRLVPAGSRAAVVSPTYGEYARVLAAAGISVDPIDTPEDVGPGHGLVVVVNPNNPDGRRHDPDALASLARRLAVRGGLLVVDEAFADGDPAQSLVPALAGLPAAIVFRSFGKFFGLAGLRLGFVIAAPPIEARLEEGLGPWAVSGPALAIATRLLKADTAAVAARIAERHEAMERVLTAAGLAIAGRNPLFLLVEEAEAAALHHHLCQAHILTRIFDYASRWMRIGLAPDPAADARLAAALAGWRQS